MVRAVGSSGFRAKEILCDILDIFFVRTTLLPEHGEEQLHHHPEEFPYPRSGYPLNLLATILGDVLDHATRTRRPKHAFCSDGHDMFCERQEMQVVVHLRDGRRLDERIYAGRENLRG